MQPNHCVDSSPPLKITSENSLKRFRNKHEDQDHDQEQEQEQDQNQSQVLRDRSGRQQKRRCRVLSGLEIPAPVTISLAPEEYSRKANDGFETPKGSNLMRSDSDQVQVEVKNPNRLCCPPAAPRKPKAAPATKRRAIWVQSSVILLDISKEVESMFPPSVLEDFGKKIKKARS